MQLQAALADDEQEIAQQAILIGQLQAQVVALQTQVDEANQKFITARLSNNSAPSKWCFGFFNQGALGTSVQNRQRILEGYRDCAASFQNLSNVPNVANPTLFYQPATSPGLQITFPGNWTTNVCVFEIEFGHETTGYANANHLQQEFYQMIVSSSSAGITPYNLAEAYNPRNITGGGGVGVPLGLKQVTRMLFTYTPDFYQQGIVVNPQFLDGNTGSSEAVYAGYSFTLKMFTNSGWAYIP